MMVRKKLALAIAAMGALQADLASALGLGEFSLNSALNQPLQAEIELLNTADLDPSQVIIKLASPDDFKRAGVSRDFFLTNLNFNVEIGSKGRGKIKVVTKDAVVEPYLNFIIEARWPSGRLLREYTVLLDLPVFSESQSSAVSSASSEPTVAAQPNRLPTPMSSSSSLDSSRRTLAQGQLDPGSEYRVRKDETLWEIAAKGRPSPRVSVQQTMVTIQRMNSEAFIGGNINRLKAGYVLRLPTEQEIGEISSSSAVQEVAKQNNAWRSGSAESEVSGAPLDATRQRSGGGESSVSDGRLSIAASGESTASDAGEGAGAGGIAALRDQLTASQETLDKSQRENGELQSRLSDMEAKIATLQRLLELKEDQLAALQAVAGDAGAVADQPANDVAGDEVVDESPAQESMSAAEEAATEPSPTEVAKPEPAKPAKAPEPKAAKEEGLLDWLLSNLTYIGIGLGGIVIAGALLLRKRRNEQEDDEFALPDEQSEELADIAFDAEPESVADEQPDSESESVAQEVAEIEAVGEELTEEPAERAPVQSETGDAIGEADIYIAYGRYQQAVDLLRTAIAAEPLRSDLRLKLMEVFVETRDKPSFQQQYLDLQASGNDEAIVQAKEMLSTVDGVEDWLAGLSAAPVSDEQMDAELIDGAEADDDALDIGDLDFDLEDIDEKSLSLDDSSDSFDEKSELDLDDAELDFDLDLEDDSELTEADTTQVEAFDVAAHDEELSLDLDELNDLEGSSELDLDEPDDLELDTGLESDELASDELELSLDSLDSESEAQPDNSIDYEPVPPAQMEPAPEAPEVAAADSSEEIEFDLDGDDDDFELSLDELSLETDEDLAAEFDRDETAGSGLETPPVESFDSGSEDLPEFDLADDQGDDELPAFEDSLADLDLSEFDAEDTIHLDVEGESSTDDLPDLGGEAEAASAIDSAPAENDDAIEMAPADAVVPENVADFSSPEDMDEDYDFLSDADEVATKLDLARAYMDMGDADGAKDILEEVLQEGNEQQKQEAKSLMERVD